MIVVIFLVVGAAFAAVGWMFAGDLAELYRKYENWISSEMAVQLGYLGWRLDQDRARRFLRMLIGIGATIGLLVSFSPMVGLYVGLVAGALPVPLTRVARIRRWAAFDDQLLDGVNLLANSVKSGLGLTQAMQVLVREMEPPISEEFDRVLKEVNMGRTIDEALEAMNERMDHPELDLVVSSIVTLRRTGGNMAETFEIISETIKDRVLVEGKIKALTGQGMMQMYMLIATPWVLGLIMYAMDSNFMRPMFVTVLGWFFLTLVAGLCFLGYLVIKRIVTIEV